METPQSLDTLEKAAQECLTGYMPADKWGDIVHPALILQLVAQLRIYKKRANRNTGKLF